MFVFPLNRDVRPPGTPWVTWGLIVLLSLLWVVPAILGVNNQLIFKYGYRPGDFSLLTLFASMFLHIGLLHVAGNLWFLWMFAPKIEARLGSLLFVVAYLVCGLGGQGLHTLFSPGSLVPTVGASGAISGVAGMYFLLYPRSPFDLVLYFGWWLRKSFRAQTRAAVGAWIGEQFLLGLISRGLGAVGGVAFWAHVGGFASGLLCAALALPKATAEERRAILRPMALTDEEKEELFADRAEKRSELTTLDLNR
ncbi:MAG: rhomboid family intramembrane serine protease [Acidobacteriaceae bacterium]|jgi:membrane associated rhomboid family serine protease